MSRSYTSSPPAPPWRVVGQLLLAFTPFYMLVVQSVPRQNITTVQFQLITEIRVSTWELQTQ
jgi:hypothetical protein